MNKKELTIRAKQGADARWHGRNQAIEVLRTKYDKKTLDKMLKWNSEALIELAKWASN